MLKAVLVGLYLAAIVAANLAVTTWGPTISIYTAFLLIGLDLTTRDKLHDLWHGRVLRNMAGLIVAGSAISYALNRSSGRIALASCAAFAAAAAADALLYHFARHREWYERANLSNLGGAGVDSALFIPLAFGVFLWPVMFGQFTAKVAGGVVWSFVLGRVRVASARSRLAHDARAVSLPEPGHP